ncbi:MAG TPA: 50S ribosomal protein L25 [Candidatus Saccharimonadales bacterium]|nr:50S ribosomal protein L25 [Candidatus Saccharimonadales bacterium]
MSQDSISLTLEPREVTGKAVKHLRRDGFIPAVIHDHGKPSVVVQADALALMKVWHQAGKHHPVELKAGDQSYVALIKTAEFDPKKNQLAHVVFNAVDKNQKVEAEIPVRPHYDEGNESSPAERNSLIVLTQLETVQVKAIATKLPDFLEYDAEKLVEIGDHVTVADLTAPEGVEIETEPEHSIATVYEPSAIAAANEAAAGDAEEGEEPVEEGAEGTEGETAEGGESAEGGNGEEGQSGESKPGGKDQKEPKPSSVEAAKEDAKAESANK